MTESLPAATPPVCPRHTGRVAYVKCQRCGRPVCPDCQRPAPVGIQCVDCVREGAASVRQASAVFGGRPTQGRPQATVTLMGLCIAAYVLEMTTPSVVDDYAFAPFLGWSEPWRFLTAAFLHQPHTILHILFNMMALWIMGQYLEPLLGRLRFVLIYALSALGGTVAVLLLSSPPSVLDNPEAIANSSWFAGVVGASGAIFGLFGAVLLLNRHLGRNSAAMYGTIAINFAIGFIYPGISWQAHLGGFVTGLACSAALTAFNKPHLRRFQFAGFAVVLAVLIAVVVVKYAGVPADIGLK